MNFHKSKVLQMLKKSLKIWQRVETTKLWQLVIIFVLAFASIYSKRDKQKPDEWVIVYSILIGTESL